MADIKPPQRIGVTRGRFGVLDEEPDYEVIHPTRVFGSHVNMIPLTGTVHAPRHFYGARFYNQALPLDNPEEPLVQNLDEESGVSFDELAGKFAGAQRAEANGVVKNVDDDGIDLEYEDGTRKRVQLYRNFPFNRKTYRNDTALVKPGDKVEANQVVSHSNFTTPTGKLALGRNARVGVVPMKGWSMDDALAVSEDFANRTRVNRTYTIEHEHDDEVKTGLNHFAALFPDRYKKEQLANLDEDGVVKVGTILNPGDPIILATAPRSATSTELKVGKLSRSTQLLRKDATQKWEYEDPAKVIDVIKTRGGYKVLTNFSSPMRVGDKGAFRSGAKFILSKISPNDQMPRTKDGKPLDVLLNQLSIYSRINSSLIYEILLGKLARKQGKPIVTPGFTKPGVSMREDVERQLKEAGLQSEEEIYDPETDQYLENPVMVGDAFVMRLHHTADDKASSRGVASYDLNQQPARGSGEGAQSKRQSGLENLAIIAGGGYGVLREMSTLRGQKHDEFWRRYKAGYGITQPGKPFVWNKFLALLNGAGLKARDRGKGVLRLGPLTDQSVDAMNPIELRNGELLKNDTLEPVPGGLFDPSLVAGNRWGKITLPEPIPNPAMEEQIRALLGLTRKQLAGIMAGTEHFPDAK